MSAPQRVAPSFVVKLPDRLAGHVQKGHPWLYVDVLTPGNRPSQTGELVTLASSDGRPLAYALYDAASPIALRVVGNRYEEPPGPSLWRKRVEAAWRLRLKAIDQAHTDGFRLLHGEGDRLPGVVVDHYAGYLVMKLDTGAWLPHLDAITQALVEVVQPRGIFLKGFTGRVEEGLSSEPAQRVLYGEEPPELIHILEHGMVLAVDVWRGQKTGLFLDQRENRALVRRMAGGLEVLNLFSYTGGFSVAAGLGGASHTVSVDVAKGALETARLNFTLNGLDAEQQAYLAEDAFDALSRFASARRQFGMVIVDPPSFAPREKALKKAQAAYVKLNEKAMRQVRPGGFLASASCSSHLSQELFLQCLREAAAEARRPLRLLEVRAEPPDHPSPLHFPEGRYLKFVLAVVD